ncbi:hypothetical protein CKG00_13205 [Morganella morganii]|uniref:Phage capsid protein n=1 Tax=Morganella morganii TaxID=582 RepID=A0A433ZYM6_MORMO|nr:GPO family capsid scaffolding protein [Morganella morganii]RUT67212.1 hypothetical protein CKG00_13205 [Morganella morganii]
MPEDNKKLQVIVCTEGGTLNGFAVTRDQIQQMADNYNPQLYAARINLEHITSVLPDSTWRHFSMIDSARAFELQDGPLKGKLALEISATIDPVKDAPLIALNESGQKIFSSIEFLPDCPNDAAKGAYLTGVALTDTPAAFGTQVITLSKQPEDKSRALELLQRALLLHSKSGVKRDIELLQRELKKADDSKQDAAPEPEKKPAKNTGTKPKPGSTKKTTTARKKTAS